MAIVAFDLKNRRGNPGFHLLLWEEQGLFSWVLLFRASFNEDLLNDCIAVENVLEMALVLRRGVFAVMLGGALLLNFVSDHGYVNCFDELRIVLKMR